MVKIPQTPIYGFDFEAPEDLPGETLTGGPSGTHPILAQQIEQVLNNITAGVAATVPAVRVYAANDMWNKPDNLLYVDAITIGGGGGAGGSASTGGSEVAAADGGNGGGYSRSIIPAESLGSSETVTVGSGGPGGSAGNNDGTAGGESSFGSHVTAPGGPGGDGGAASTSHNMLGSPPVAAAGTGQIATTSFSSEGAVRFPSINTCQGGRGGSTPLGSGSPSQTNGSSGTSGSPYGGGGGGASSRNSDGPYAGGDGADGVVIIVEYYAVIL